MSRIGKRPVVAPSGVKMMLEGNVLKVEGPKGKLSMEIPGKGNVQVSVGDGQLLVKRLSDLRVARCEQGLVRALAANMVAGVTKGFSKDLDIVGVGYKAEVKGQILNLNLGYSHPIAFEIPKGIQITMEKMTHITVSGADKCLVGETAAHLRRLRPPEPYKGKGVKYTTEHIRRKAGKAAVGAGTGVGGAKGGA
jgi:large subunit ribosomal protein L6